MSLLGRLFGAILGPESSAVGEVASPPNATRYAEAAGATVDADDNEWRRLSGDSARDLAPMTQQRMQRLAQHVWESNLLANRLIELPLAYLLSQGVTWRVDDDAAQAALKAHWNDGINAYRIKLPKRVRELALFGEQCYPVFRDVHTGFVRLGYLDPAQIETVVMDPDNTEQPIGVVTRRNAKGAARRYRVIVNAPESAFSPRTQEIRATFSTGDAFYFRVNDLCSTTRGRSDLLAQLDWLDAYDQFLFGELDRAHHTRAFIWDVKITGATPEEVKQRASEITPPRANSVRVHNESEEWNAASPELNAYDAGQAARLFRNHVLGGASVPEHWYGGAEDVNKSTGASMTEPTEKMLDMRQAFVGYMLEEIGRYVVRSHWNALERELSTDQVEILDTLVVEWPELTAKDTTKYAAALQQIVAAVSGALAEQLITRETALRLISAMAKRLGVEIDVVEELERALAELPRVPDPEPEVVPPPVPANADE